jgi:CheY-like chemotaxis protein
MISQDTAMHGEPLGAKRTLIVEDDPGVRETLKLLLRSLGHTVTAARNGREACLLFAPGDFDLVITDYGMPEMNGDELARTIKCLVPSQPILMLTAQPGRFRCPENPVDAILMKPFGIADLRRTMNALGSAHKQDDAVG